MSLEPYLSFVFSFSASTLKAFLALPRITSYACSLYLSTDFAPGLAILTFDRPSIKEPLVLNLSSWILGVRLSLFDGSNGLYAPPSHAGSSPEIVPVLT